MTIQNQMMISQFQGENTLRERGSERNPDDWFRKQIRFFLENTADPQQQADHRGDGKQRIR